MEASYALCDFPKIGNTFSSALSIDVVSCNSTFSNFCLSSFLDAQPVTAVCLVLVLYFIWQMIFWWSYYGYSLLSCHWRSLDEVLLINVRSIAEPTSISLLRKVLALPVFFKTAFRRETAPRDMVPLTFIFWLPSSSAQTLKLSTIIIGLWRLSSETCSSTKMSFGTLALGWSSK